MDLLSGTDRPGLVDRLRALEDALGDLGIDLRQFAAPGLEDAAFDQVTDRTGLTLPEEAKDWFRWQNGPADAVGPFGVGPSLTPEWYFMSLEGAIRNYLDGRQQSRQLASGPDDEGFWPPGLFPIARGGGSLVVHCGVDAVRAPVDIVHTWSELPGEEWLFDSIADLVDLLTRACRIGAFAIAPDAPTQLIYTQYPVPDEIAHPDFW